MYLPVSTAAYFVYGDKNEDNILGVLSASWLTTTATCLITVHLIMGFIIVINPLSQEVEDFLGIDKGNRIFPNFLIRFLGNCSLLIQYVHQFIHGTDPLFLKGECLIINGK